METPQEFAAKWLRNGIGRWPRLYFYFAMGLVLAGTFTAFWEFWDEPRELVVPLLLAGIAFLLLVLVPCVEGILVDLEYSQKIEEEKRGKI